MTADLPAWIPAESGSFPTLPEAEGRVGRVVVLLGTEGALSAGWVGNLAVDLAASWSDGGDRVVVADAGLSTPLLNEELGIPNHEGLVDALRWGVSVQRAVQRVEGRRFLALTAGTAVADTAGVLALPRWHALCAGFREAGVTLAVLVPSWEEALPAVLGEADAVVVLAERDEDVGDLVSGLAVPVLAVLGREGPSAIEPVRAATPDVVTEAEDAPAGQPVEDALPVEPLAEPSEEVLPDHRAGTMDQAETRDSDDVSDWGSLVDEEPEGEEGLEGLLDQPEADDGVTVHGFPEVAADSAGDPFAVEQPYFGSDATAPDEDPFILPDPIPVPPSLEEIVGESEGPARRGRARMLLFILFVVVVAAGVAAWFGYLEIPGLTPRRDNAWSTLPPAAEPLSPPRATSAAQGYSLALGAYQDSLVAAERVATLAAQVPGVLFQSVPVEVDGTLFHRVLAGPGADSAAVAALAARIADAAALDSSPWVGRWTPKAFYFGDMPDLEAAERRVGSLAGLGVSAYVLAVDYSDGSVRYRVFAGAFADAEEASYLSGILDERGLSSATLSDRIGRLPE